MTSFCFPISFPFIDTIRVLKETSRPTLIERHFSRRHKEYDISVEKTASQRPFHAQLSLVRMFSTSVKDQGVWLNVLDYEAWPEFRKTRMPEHPPRNSYECSRYTVDERLHIDDEVLRNGY